MDFFNLEINSDAFSCVDCHAIHELQDKYKELKLDFIISDLENIFNDLAGGIVRITDIIQSLRVYARSSKDDEKDTNILLELIQQVILILKNEVKYVADIKMDVSEDIALYCNRIQIGQVFVNIILNAIQAIKSQNRNSMGKILIKANCFDNQVLIEFTDDGPGIPEENLLKIFEPFFTTKEIGKGTGLGLSISYDIIVNKHNGNIDVKSEVGKGTSFLITLPLFATE
jgi:Signal transduction histidine kinase regulating C4-dicarboxylate transport system